MGEDLLVGGAKESLAFEIAVAEKAVVQTAAVADVVPLAFGTIALGYVFGTFVYLALLDARQYLRQGLVMQVAISELPQVVVAEAAARHNITVGCYGHEIVLAVAAEHAACCLASGDVAGNLDEVRLCYLALLVVEPQVEQFDAHLRILLCGNAIFVAVMFCFAGDKEWIELEAQFLFLHKPVEFGDTSDVLATAHHDTARFYSTLSAQSEFLHNGVESGASTNSHTLAVVDFF